jgi:hypothetical protein
LIGMVTDRNSKATTIASRDGGARQETLLPSLGNSSDAYILLREAVPDYNVPK